MTSISDSFFGFLEAKRQTFWHAHTHWSETARHEAWERQKAELAAQLLGGSAATRMDSEGDYSGPTVCLDQQHLVRASFLGRNGAGTNWRRIEYLESPSGHSTATTVFLSR